MARLFPSEDLLSESVYIIACFFFFPSGVFKQVLSAAILSKCDHQLLEVFLLELTFSPASLYLVTRIED